MPDFTLRHPDSGEEFVVGNASDRARLQSQGYRDVTREPAPDTPADAPAEDLAAAVPVPAAPAGEDTASTPDNAADPAPARPARPGPPRGPKTGEAAGKPATDA